MGHSRTEVPTIGTHISPSSVNPHRDTNPACDLPQTLTPPDNGNPTSRGHENTGCLLLNLPPEIFQMILALLNPRSLASLSSVNKYIKGAAEHYLYGKCEDLGDAYISAMSFEHGMLKPFVSKILCHTDVNAMHSGYTAIHWWVYGHSQIYGPTRDSKESMLNLLMRHNPDLEAITGSGRWKRHREGLTALEMAMHFGDETAILLLIKARAKIDPQLLITFAMDHGMADLAGYLFDSCGAYVDGNSADCLVQTLYRVRGQWRRHRLSRVVGMKGVTNLDPTSEVGDAALVLALIHGLEAEAVRLLRGHATFENADKLLRLAATGGSVEAVRILCDNHCAHVSTKDDQGKTALHLAVRHRSPEVARLLILKGADVNATCDSLRTPLVVAAGCGRNVVLELLLDNGAEVNVPDERNTTALHLAASFSLPNHFGPRNTYRRLDLLKPLLSHGADVQAQDSEGRTALYLAVELDDRSVAELLLQHGANCHTGTMDGTSPLSVAKPAMKRILQPLDP